MKIFTNKNIVQKIIIAIVIVILCNFCVPMTTVHAGVASVLQNAIINLIAVVFDAVNYGLQFIMLGDTQFILSETNPRYWGNSVCYI